jgi:hypothetical protein
MSSPVTTCSVDGRNSIAFRPYLIPQYPSIAGLRIFVGPGSVYINNATVNVYGGFVPLAPLAVNYVYLNMRNAMVETGLGSFSGNVWPIATVITNQTEIVTLVDSRGINGPIMDGAHGHPADTVYTLNVSGTLAIETGNNYFCPVADGTTQALPAPGAFAGTTIKFLKNGSGLPVTITGGNSGTYFLSNQGQSVWYQTDGIVWDVVGGTQL